MRGQDQFSSRREGGGTRVAVRVLVLVARPRGCETVTRRATAVATPDAVARNVAAGRGRGRGGKRRGAVKQRKRQLSGRGWG